MLMMLTGPENVRWVHARQMGITQVVAKLAPELTGKPSPWDEASLMSEKQRYAEAGLEIVLLEGDQFDMRRIKWGLPGRDEDIDLYRRMLRNMGRNGIPTLNYNFMVSGVNRDSAQSSSVSRQSRSDYTIAGRGGAMVSGYDRVADEALGVTAAGEISAGAVFDNYRYFLNAVLPVAEESGVTMCLHPDDPPVPSLRGVGRPFGTEADFDRVFALSDSPSHKMTLCQGSFASGGQDVVGMIRKYGAAKRIGFAHFRDVRRTATGFYETFPDDGETDMRAVAEAYRDVGYDGAIRPDHAPAMTGDPTSQSGRVDGTSAMAYSPGGMIFTTAYLRGLFEGAGYPLK
jgi:mannonate dehydratase